MRGLFFTASGLKDKRWNSEIKFHSELTLKLIEGLSNTSQVLKPLRVDRISALKFTFILLYLILLFF